MDVLKLYHFFCTEYLQRQRLQNFPGRLVLVLSHPHREVFPDVQIMFQGFSLCWNTACFSLWLLLLVLSLLLRRAWSIFLPFRCKKGPLCTLPSGIYILWSYWAFSAPGWKPHLLYWKDERAQPFHIGDWPQSLHHCFGFLMDSIQYVHVSLVVGSSELITVFQVCPHQCWAERRDACLPLA